MDGKVFRDRLDRLKKGEFPNDPSVFEYANNAAYEYRALFDAMRTCCTLQKQKVELLRQMNSAMEKSLRERNAKIAELERQVSILMEREGML